MHTLKLLSSGLKEVPAQATWYLADISEFKGKQELYTRQAPQKLKVLREHALIESAVSSNRIEGVEIDRKRIGTVLFGRPLLKDRNEEEIQGYRNALEWIHNESARINIDPAGIRKLHKMCRGDIWDAGKYKEKDGDIIERLASGEVRVRFKTVSAAQTPQMTKETFSLWNSAFKEGDVHPLLLIAACNLDFLCIHPFRDGNGRVSRLLLLLQLYRAGYEVGRYISLERLIEEHKQRYYETLELSSRGWHEGRHDPWPYTNYILFILKSAYKEFAERLGQIGMAKGEKTSLVVNAIAKRLGPFQVSDIQRDCPNVSMDMIRRVLKDLRADKKVECLGRGQNAQWQKTKRWQLGKVQ